MRKDTGASGVGGVTALQSVATDCDRVRGSVGIEGKFIWILVA